MKSTLRLILVLLVACALAAGALSLVNAVTKDRIAGFARQEREQALKQVFPAAEEFREVLPGRHWEALAGGVPVGHVFAATIQGYSGPILSFFGLGADNTVTSVKVLTHSETPGLGAKIVEEGFLKQFAGLSNGQIALRRDDPQGRIDAITAATISSRALTASLRATLDGFLKGDLQ